MTPIFFPNTTAFRTWLAENYNKQTELYVGYYKVSTGKPCMTWSESVDVALCFGWIDGIRRSVDSESYCSRFTPRKPNSNWSAVNLKKMEVLIKEGLMHEAGLAIYNLRKPENCEVYSFENETKQLPADLEKQFKANKKAWDFFSKQAPSYKKAKILWLLAAKQEATKWIRLEKLISESEKQNRVF